MRRHLLQLLLVPLLIVGAASGVHAAGVDRFAFDVYLNNKKVGRHSFEIIDRGGEKTVQSIAEFKYKVLFIPAYRYQHSNAERWRDGCLIEFAAETNANGKQIEVSGEITETGFRVEKANQPTQLPECIMSFAYWNPSFLNEPQLLNPQTGDYVDVRVEEVGNETLQVRGEAVAAKIFRLTAYNVDLTLWYSPDDEWLALESVAKGGHVIRYELS
jgi:hypothetical protein